MRRVGRSAVGWLGADGLPDDIVDALWPVARGAAEDAGRDPDALKKAISPETSGVVAGGVAATAVLCCPDRLRCGRLSGVP